ncbi:histone-like nucleoid-structuring protein Lsr2 [Sediminivirga luteola]|jgi:hypothetical protein|uniref:histone-like nucleoid-structuring protein Lsr2 n=1 Tax=Sediminivirga luteola TaxID=1774748 RepID=UPI001F57C15E|nr:Lsr2 family protein [Sediminivirga luteola]MCI2264762.1 Lsr2 family protein [Sediminivirga luteola]
MAQKVKVILIDDLDGGEAAETVRFGLDGVDYEIDLSQQHAEELRGALSPYLGKARRVSAARSRARRTQSGGSGSSSGGSLTKVRAWAREQGYQIGDRGRVPQEIVEAYKAAH